MEIKGNVIFNSFIIIIMYVFPDLCMLEEYGVSNKQISQSFFFIPLNIWL